MTFANSLAPVLITGGTGRTGARLVRRLVDRGVAVRIGSRSAQVEPFLDLADVAVDSFTSDRHVGRLLELTGPRLLTLHDVAAELSAATGRQIVFVPCTAGEFATDPANDGIRAEEALPLAGLFTEILDGRNSSVTADLGQALNRAPTDFSTYASRTANTGLWAAPVHAGLQ